MMKHFYLKVVIGCILGTLANTSHAQLANPPIHIETIVHYGNYGEAGHDLTGYVTYKVYVQFANQDNYLTGLFAAESPFDCVQDADSTLHFEFPCGLFQHELSGAYGYNQSCLYPAIVPTSQFDSFLTIGKICGSQPGCDLIGAVSQCPAWLSAFEGPSDANYYDGGTFFWDEAAIFSASCFQPYPTSISHADGNSRVLIGQFTTCGDWTGCVNIQYINQASVDQVALDICFGAEMPCLANVMDNTATVTPALCAGDDATVTLDDGGNGPINFMLYNSSNALINTFTNQNNGLSVSPIPAGSYYITMIDSVGCRDTTDLFNVIDPTPLVFDAELLSDVQCFGETTGSISLTCSGGTGTINVLVNGVAHNCGDVLSNLACGPYNGLATDANGCQVSELIQVSCPPQLMYNPIVTSNLCYNDDNGSIVGNVTGGTGNITADWFFNTAPYDQIIGVSPLNISISDLDGGTYDAEITDANNCTLTASFEVTEPDEFLIEYTVTDVTCFGLCNGSIATQITGGQVPFLTTGAILNGGPVNLGALCANEIVVTTIDGNNCQIQDTLEVMQPTDITYELELVPVTCFGQCDGQIQITNVDGSFGNFSYQLAPNSGNCTAPCSGNDATFTDLCAGTYNVLITDETSCPKTLNNLIITTPDEMQLTLTPTSVTCFGLSDGSVAVSVIGGTEPIVITPGDSIAPYTITDLAQGNYSFTVTDANGCFTTGDVIVNQPDSLKVTTLLNIPATCGGYCDGRLNYVVAGGTVPYQYQLLPTGTVGPVNGFLNSLCANQYNLVVTDLFQCADTLEFEITQPDPLVINTLLDAPTCTGMFDGSALVELSGGTGALTFFVEPSSTNVLNIDSANYSLSGLGETVIYFQLIDSQNCILSDTLEIVPDIITDMVMSVFSSPETCWNELDGTATVAVQNGFLPISYLWDDPHDQITATAAGLSSNQQYTVIVTDNIGCTLTTSVFVEGTLGCFFIATAITPNGDGVNDEWILGGLEFYSQAKINVYNRWGQNVFSSNGYSTRWDARYQGELLPVADYYFTIDYAADKEVIMGTVTIKY